MNKAIDPKPSQGPTGTFRHLRGRRRWTAVAATVVAAVVIAGGDLGEFSVGAIGSSAVSNPTVTLSKASGNVTGNGAGGSISILDVTPELGGPQGEFTILSDPSETAVAIPAFMRNARKAKTAE